MNGEYISLYTLLQNGHSPRTAWQLLGLPDHSTTQAPFPKNPKHHFYLRERAAAKTTGRTFQAVRLTEILHRVVAGENKLKQLTIWAETIPIEADLPDLH